MLVLSNAQACQAESELEQNRFDGRCMRSPAQPQIFGLVQQSNQTPDAFTQRKLQVIKIYCYYEDMAPKPFGMNSKLIERC